MKISIITPAFNSCDTLQRAIESVLAQKYPNFEHIVVDGGSSDGTVDLLGRYSHIKWISEPDEGQVDAMQKGFAMSVGEIIGNLNADDHYLPGAFAAVMREFSRGADFVVGKVRVESEHDASTWVNDPKVDLPSMLKHWLPDAFCVNPVGYFYRRRVQEAVPFDRENDDKHDLEFLLEAASRFEFRKIDAVLGVFAHVMKAKTFRQQMRPGYWRVANFAFVERVLDRMDPAYQRRFRLERERGYQLRRQWTIQQAHRLSASQRLYDEGEILLLPEDDSHSDGIRDGFVEFQAPAAPGDSVLLVLGPCELQADAIARALRSVAKEELPIPVYRVGVPAELATAAMSDPQSPAFHRAAIAKALQFLVRHRREDLRWKLIVGVQDPILAGLARAVTDGCEPQELASATLKHATAFVTDFSPLKWLDLLGVNVLSRPFDHAAGWTLYEEADVTVLVCRCEDLPRAFGRAMDALLGLPDLALERGDASTCDPESGQERAFSGEAVDLDPDAIRQIYSSELVRHFYTTAEIEAFCEKWKGGRARPAHRGVAMGGGR